MNESYLPARIINAMTITQVWVALGGEQPERGRARAFYRSGDNPQAVSLNDAKRCWFDYRDGKGGGVLDLIQRVLGCNPVEALHWLSNVSGISLQDQPTKMRQTNSAHRRVIVEEYKYTDEAGKLLYEVVRFEPKSFAHRYPDGAGGWVWKKYPHPVLYRLPEVLEATIVFLVEGERDAETLRACGFVATTAAGGAKAPWLPQFTDALRGRDVILIPDRDRAGYERVKRIARALMGRVARLVYLELEDGKDVTEWFERGHSELELISQLDGKEVAR
ncbi:MAG TPA: toprim domain-containing protein [Bryobacteraceae bacterium]|nr:toprim domain-containing protein [Bryobacteraceae bacterium]